jgi:hypothetical protein
MKKLLITICCFTATVGFAQVPFGHEQAIHVDSNIFAGWATGCTLQRGYQNIADPSSGYTNVGDELIPVGKALTNGIVSLGDGGSAILTFDKPIRNEAGADFAVFENGFALMGDTLFYLELAFVEVSSDGQNYFRFPASSLTDTTIQADNATGTDPHNLYNLAGKYMVRYGTPFDLEELKNNAALDVDHITHIKIIDVVGSIHNTYARRDSANRKINDPWPTPFGSSGFDLAGIGVIHQQLGSGLDQVNAIADHINVYPVPAKRTDVLTIANSSSETLQQLEVLDISGRSILKQPFTGSVLTLNLSAFDKGMYLIKLTSSNTITSKKIIVN